MSLAITLPVGTACRGSGILSHLRSMNTNRLATWGASFTLACFAVGGIVVANDDTLAAFEERLESARNDLKEAERARMDAFRAAETDMEQAAALAVNPWKGFRERFDELAFDAAGTDVAAGAWATIFAKEIDFGTQDNAWEAYEQDYKPLFGLAAPEQLKKDLLRAAHLNGFASAMGDCRRQGV